MIQTRPVPLERPAQGDIYRDLEHIEYAMEREGQIEISKIVFPLSIVLTQDCDLEQDNRYRSSSPPPRDADKLLLSVLVAPLFTLEHVVRGEHLSEVGRQMSLVPAKGNSGDFLRHNERPRYHYVELPQAVGVAPSVIDFKLYFSVDASLIRRAHSSKLVCNLGDLYREDISQRFAAFLSRIGLP